jgi:hypothetical protein
MFAPLVTPLHQMPTAHPTTPEENPMRSKITKVMIAAAAVAVTAAPSAALAKHGADDGPAHKRHARHHHVIGHDARHGHGADDGPNHR